MPSKIVSARERLAKYPLLLSKCSKEAATYGSCISQQAEIKRDICEKEFTKLIHCIRKASVELRTKV